MKISDKNMKVCILVYFRFILSLALKALFLVCESYFGRNDRFVQLNLKFLQPFGSFLCAFFKDLECASEANTDIFFMQSAVSA